MVDKSHSTVEENNGFTSTPIFTSPSKDHHSDGFMLLKQKTLKRMDNLAYGLGKIKVEVILNYNTRL